MILIGAFLFALLPLLGIAWVFMNGLVFTVDGLFMSLILLTISGICGTTGLYEIRKRISAPAAGAVASAGATSSGLMQSGRVQSVEFFEANVGQPNKSIVTFLDGYRSLTVVFEGDMRNALPIGQKLQVTVRKESGYNVLLNVSNA
jgi:hypothetical protein